MTQDAARSRAIEALGDALDDHLDTEEADGLRPNYWRPYDFARWALDYLDAHPEAKAALAAWLCEPRSRIEDPARDNVWHGKPAPARRHPAAARTRRAASQRTLTSRGG